MKTLRTDAQYLPSFASVYTMILPLGQVHDRLLFLHVACDLFSQQIIPKANDKINDGYPPSKWSCLYNASDIVLFWCTQITGFNIYYSSLCERLQASVVLLEISKRVTNSTLDVARTQKVLVISPFLHNALHSQRSNKAIDLSDKNRALFRLCLQYLYKYNTPNTPDAAELACLHVLRKILRDSEF
jgi:hypothetical protein